MLTGVLVFLLGASLLGWHWAHERYRVLRREFREVVKQNGRLICELEKAGKAIRPEQVTPRPEFWSDRSYDRLASDLGLRLVDVESGREAHSHATKTSENPVPKESA